MARSQKVPDKNRGRVFARGDRSRRTGSELKRRWGWLRLSRIPLVPHEKETEAMNPNCDYRAKDGAKEIYSSSSVTTAIPKPNCRRPFLAQP
jgi:hypothetical protein